MGLEEILRLYDDSESKRLFEEAFKIFNSELNEKLMNIKKEVINEIIKINNDSFSQVPISDFYGFLLKMKFNQNLRENNLGFHIKDFENFEIDIDYYSNSIKNKLYLENRKSSLESIRITNEVDKLKDIFIIKESMKILLPSFQKMIDNKWHINQDIQLVELELFVDKLFNLQDIEHKHELIDYKHNLSLKTSLLEAEKDRFKQLELSIKNIKEELEIKENELMEIKDRYAYLKNYNQIIPNFRYRGYIVNIEYCDFAILYSLFDAENLFYDTAGNKINISQFIYLFDIENNGSAIQTYIVNFKKAKITVQEFGLFLHNLYSYLLKRELFKTFNDWILWINNHFKFESSSGKAILNFRRYVKPHKDLLKSNEIRNFYQMFQEKTGNR